MKKLTLLLILATLVSCGGKTGPVGIQGPKGDQGIPGADGKDAVGLTAQEREYFFEGATKFLEAASATNGEKNSIAKRNTRQTDYFIFSTPAFDGKYLAVDLSGYTTDQSIKSYLDSLAASWGYNELYDNFHFYGDIEFEIVGIPVYPVDDANLLNFPGELLFRDSDGRLFEAGSSTTKDVEAIGSKLESAEVEAVKEGLLSYGLSVERTEKLSKLMTSYRKISNKRALSASEKDVFTKELLGMKFDQAAKKMVEDYDGLIETAADKNGTSPEAVKELVNTFLTR